MRRYFFPLFLVLMLNSIWAASSVAQADRGTIVGSVKDTSGAILPGARVELEQGPSAISDNQGQLTIANVPAGTYDATVNYVGFAPSKVSVTVAGGQTAHLNVSSILPLRTTLCS
jgi:hypothetical protein